MHRARKLLLDMERIDSGSDGTRLIIIGLGRRRSSFRRFGFFFPQKRETKKKAGYGLTVWLSRDLGRERLG